MLWLVLGHKYLQNGPTAPRQRSFDVDIEVEVVVLGQVEEGDPVVGLLSLQIKVITVPGAVLLDGLGVIGAEFQDAWDTTGHRLRLQDVRCQPRKFFLDGVGHVFRVDWEVAMVPAVTIMVGAAVPHFLYRAGRRARKPGKFRSPATHLQRYG